MDINRLMAEAIAKHGVKLDAADPAMVIVTLNRLMLEDAVHEVADEIRKAASEFEAAGERLQKGVGTALAREIARNGKGGSSSTKEQWLKVAVVALGSFALGLIVERLL
ncbi:MAG: hypothetical protein K2X03_08950 [Bryobacteraceae bacterium]|nr:hypothetical protein [Bryobacteraceae bacterium]